MTAAETAETAAMAAGVVVVAKPATWPRARRRAVDIVSEWEWAAVQAGMRTEGLRARGARLFDGKTAAHAGEPRRIRSVRAGSTHLHVSHHASGSICHLVEG